MMKSLSVMLVCSLFQTQLGAAAPASDFAVRSDWQDSFGTLRADQLSVTLYSAYAVSQAELIGFNQFVTFVNVSTNIAHLGKYFGCPADATDDQWVTVSTSEASALTLSGPLEIFLATMCSTEGGPCSYNDSMITYGNSSFKVADGDHCQEWTSADGKGTVMNPKQGGGIGIARCVLDLSPHID